MLGKLTLKYIIDIDFLKKNIDRFKDDYSNLLYYLNSHNNTDTKVDEENLIYEINLYSYYKDVKGQANLYLLKGNQIHENGFVNACNFSTVASVVNNDNIYYLFKTNSNNVVVLKNHKELIKFSLNKDINEFSLLYLFNIVDFDIDKMDSIVNCLNFGMEQQKNIFETFLQKCIDFS